MNREHSIDIAAPAPTVWAVYSDVERWPEWTRSVRRVTPMDGRDLVVGARFKIEQPRLPKIVWEVIEIDAGHAWKWRNASLGTTTIGWHEVAPIDERHTRVRQGIDQHGFLAPLLGVFSSGLTERYLEMESQGLKARSEQRASDDTSL